MHTFRFLQFHAFETNLQRSPAILVFKAAWTFQVQVRFSPVSVRNCVNDNLLLLVDQRVAVQNVVHEHVPVRETTGPIMTVAMIEEMTVETTVEMTEEMKETTEMIEAMIGMTEEMTEEDDTEESGRSTRPLDKRTSVHIKTPLFHVFLLFYF